MLEVDAWISELSSAFLDIANSGIYLTKAMGPTPGPLKITFAHHFAKLDSLQLQSEWNGLRQQIEAVRGRRPGFLSAVMFELFLL